MYTFKTLKKRGARAAAALLLVIIFALSSCLCYAQTPVFPDVPARHWAYPYVRACARAGIIRGTDDGFFEPDSPLTLEELIVLTGRACFETEAQYAIKEGDDWSSAYIRAAQRLGVVTDAKPSEIYEPARRCDAAQIVARASVLLRGERHSPERFGEEEDPGYSLSRYGQGIGYCLASGLMSCGADGLFHGTDTLTRADAARIICELAELDTREADLSSYEPPKKKNNRIYVLMYHSVVKDGECCGPWTTDESGFRADLEWLYEHGYRTVLPRDLAAGVPLPERAVMITFDDGYSDNYFQAFPLLREYGAKAAIAVIGNRLDGDASAELSGKPADAPGNTDEFLNWDMAREMAASGLVEFGSHTYDLHAEREDGSAGIGRLSGESRADYRERVSADLKKSASRIEEELGEAPIYFAYPYGKADSWADGIVSELFEVSVITKPGRGSLIGGLYKFPRYNVNQAFTAEYYLPD